MLESLTTNDTRTLDTGVVGVPDISPVVGLSVSPFGSDPNTENVSGPVPPEVVKVWEYGTFT